MGKLSSSGSSDTSNSFASSEHLRLMTHGELRAWGVAQIAYVREVVYGGEQAFAIHAADGTPMALAEDHESAVEAILEHELIPTWLH